MKNSLIGFITITLSTLCPSAPASIMVYTERSAWVAAVSFYVTEDFEGLSPDTFTLGDNDAGRITVRVSGLNSGVLVGQNAITRDSTSPFNVNDSTQLTLETDRDGVDQQLVDILFGHNINAFAGDWNSTTSSSGLTVTLGSEVIKFNEFLTGMGDGFLGFVSSAAFSIARFDQLNLTENVAGFTNNEVFGLDNLSISEGVVAINAVPAPSSFMLFGLGLAVLVFAKHRCTRSAQSPLYCRNQSTNCCMPV